MSIAAAKPGAPSETGVRLVHLATPLLGTVGGAYLAPLMLARQLEALGVRVRVFTQHVAFGDEPVPASLAITRPWMRHGCRWHLPLRVLARQIVRAVRRERPDAVLVCGTTLLARWLLRSPIADRLAIWETTNVTPGNKFIDWPAVPLLGRCRAMLSPSATIDAAIREVYGYRGPILRLPFWVEDEHLPPASPPARFEADFLYLGRRDLEKGLMELVRATARVARAHPDVRVLIAGGGSEEPFRGEAERLGVAERIAFRFFPTREQTMAAVAASRYLVLPSYHEGYPLVLLEAAQHGVPFLSTRVGSVAEVFGGSGAATIIPPRDEDALAEAMLQALRESPAAYAARRAAARAAFHRVSSDDAIRARLAEVLADLPGGRE